MFSLDSNLKFYFNINFEIIVSPTVTTKFSKLPKLILFVKNMYLICKLETIYSILYLGEWSLGNFHLPS
jgi:hypothetical protein